MNTTKAASSEINPGGIVETSFLTINLPLPPKRKTAIEICPLPAVVLLNKWVTCELQCSKYIHWHLIKQVRVKFQYFTVSPESCDVFIASFAGFPFFIIYCYGVLLEFGFLGPSYFCLRQFTHWFPAKEGWWAECRANPHQRSNAQPLYFSCSWTVQAFSVSGQGSLKSCSPLYVLPVPKVYLCMWGRIGGRLNEEKDQWFALELGNLLSIEGSASCSNPRGRWPAWTGDWVWRRGCGVLDC